MMVELACRRTQMAISLLLIASVSRNYLDELDSTRISKAEHEKGRVVVDGIQNCQQTKTKSCPVANFLCRLNGAL